MAVTDGLRARLNRLAPATSAQIGESGFLLAGAAAGAVGWGGTQLLAWLDPPNSALAATALWAVLMVAFSGLTVRFAPEALRFSDPMLVWGAGNSAAMAVTVAGLSGLVTPRVAFWLSWAGASTVGYLGTGGLLVRAGTTDRGRSYLATGAVAFAVLLAGVVVFGAIAPVAFLLLAAVHAAPLVLDARTALGPLGRAGTLVAVVTALVGVGLAA
jgi:hypothetical protein